MTPKSCPNFLFWTLLCPSPIVASQHGPVTRYVHAPDPMHTHGYPMGSDGVKMVKKSISQLWSGIVLEWSEWPKNAPKVLKKFFFWFFDARRGYPGLPPRYPAEHRNRNFAHLHGVGCAVRYTSWRLCRIRARPTAPFLARTWSINEGVRAKLRFRCSAGYPGGSPGAS